MEADRLAERAGIQVLACGDMKRVGQILGYRRSLVSSEHSPMPGLSSSAAAW